MGGQMQGQSQRGTYEEALRPRAMQVGGLFGSQQITDMLVQLLQSGLLHQGAGGFLQAPGGVPSVNVPTFQGPGGNTLFDVGTLPPQLQAQPAAPGQVAAPGTAPPSLQGDVRAPTQPVPPVQPAPGAALPPPPPSLTPGFGGVGINMPQWIAELIGAITGGGAQGTGTGGDGANNVPINLGLIGDPTGGQGLFSEGGTPASENEINPFENLGPGQVGG